MLLRYIVSPVTVQGHASDYKAVSLQYPINHFLSPFFLSACLLSSGIISQPFAIIYTLSVTVTLQSGHCLPGLSWSLFYQSILASRFTQIAYIMLERVFSLPFPYIQLLLNPRTSLYSHPLLLTAQLGHFAYRSAPPPFHYLHHLCYSIGGPPLPFSKLTSDSQTWSHARSCHSPTTPYFLFSFHNLVTIVLPDLAKI